MTEERPEKDAMRTLWAECVSDIDDNPVVDEDSPPPPLYLSLCGAKGLDILKLVEHGIVARTETGAIEERDLGKVVAIEVDPNAAHELRETFSGLDVLDRRLEDLLSMPSDMAWPERKMRRVLRSRVVNLDLNTSLAARIKQNQLHFPVVKMVEKFAVLHAQDPQVNWSLCLTLHADLALDSGAIGRISSFLAENFKKEEVYAAASEGLLGSDLYEMLSEGKCPDGAFDDLEPSDVQNLLMALIPKRIISDTHRLGWKVTTRRNLRYGADPVAPMVSWILDFDWDPRGSSAPQELYSECLEKAVASVEEIDSDGNLLDCAA
ncbi:MAG: hypothetical protein ACJ75T_05920 [Solirubrobacterales bacterium]